MNARGNVFRFAVGTPDGPRSSIWRVKGKPSGDIYIGTGPPMDDVQLSLHQSGVWRFAYTSESAKTTPNGDRVLVRYKPEETVPGWCRGVLVTLPGSTLQPPFDYPRLNRPSAPVHWLAAPGVNREWRVTLLVMAPDSPTGLGLRNLPHEIGKMLLADGTGLWLIASNEFTPLDERAFFDRHRRQIRDDSADPGRPWPSFTVMATDDETPMMLDIGDPFQDTVS